MNGERNRWLLGIALVLAAIKFLLMPWLEHQAVAAERLAVLTQRLDRSTGVIQNRAAITQALGDLRAAVAAPRGRFPDAADASAFRLGAQQGVSAVVSQAGLSLKIFEWVVDGVAAAGGLEYSRARIQFEGGFKSVVDAEVRLETSFPNMAIRELNLIAATPLAEVNQSLVTLTLIADFHYRPTADAKELP